MGGPDERAVDREEVLQIAHLARLRLADDEVATFTEQLNDILSHAQEIADAEARAATAPSDADAPASYGGAASLRLRDPEAPADPLLAGPESFAPVFPDGLFAVPRLAALDGEPTP
jgi:aspartyl-tRNA(Asn)/glutamyl-tRNA(Gln) amidotransferase subunit C